MNQLNILFYETAKTFWLAQKKMSKLFGVEVNTINYHIKEIYKCGELLESSTIRNFQMEGKREVNED